MRSAEPARASLCLLSAPSWVLHTPPWVPSGGPVWLRLSDRRRSSAGPNEGPPRPVVTRRTARPRRGPLGRGSANRRPRRTRSSVRCHCPRKSTSAAATPKRLFDRSTMCFTTERFALSDREFGICSSTVRAHACSIAQGWHRTARWVDESTASRTGPRHLSQVTEPGSRRERRGLVSRTRAGGKVRTDRCLRRDARFRVRSW